MDQDHAYEQVKQEDAQEEDDLLRIINPEHDLFNPVPYEEFKLFQSDWADGYEQPSPLKDSPSLFFSKPDPAGGSDEYNEIPALLSESNGNEGYSDSAATPGTVIVKPTSGTTAGNKLFLERDPPAEKVGSGGTSNKIVITLPNPGSELGTRRPGRKRQFTPEEDQKLLELVRIHGEAAWAVIAKLMPGRNRKQLRDHYVNLLKGETC